MLGVEVPTTLLRGDPTLPLIVTPVERLAAAMGGTEVVVVPESHDHGASYGHCRRRTETGSGTVFRLFFVLLRRRRTGPVTSR
jgi:hypothetical protein